MQVSFNRHLGNCYLKDTASFFQHWAGLAAKNQVIIHYIKMNPWKGYNLQRRIRFSLRNWLNFANLLNFLLVSPCENWSRLKTF